MDMIYQWIDLIWLPLGLFVAEKNKRIWMAAFMICNMVMMRLLVELMTSTGYEHGILPFMTSHVFDRGLVVYSIFYMLFCILAHYSPRSDKHVFMGASITVFFIAGVTATIVMLL